MSGSNKASFAKAMEAYKVSDNLSNGLFALDIGLKEINWENTTIDRIYQYTAVKYADEEYLAMLGYLADNATYSVVKDAAYELKQQSEEPTEKALENLRKDAAGDQAWIIGDAIWQKTFDSCEYLKIAKIGFDLGVQFSNMFFHTADSVNTKDSMRSLSYIGQTLGEWSVDSWSKYLNTNDVSEKNKYAKQCVYATQMTWKVRKLGEECFRKWCVLFNQDKASNISLSVTSLLDDMDDFVNSTETTEDFQDYVNSSICCPVDIQVYRGNHIILTIKDGIESNGQIDGLKYEVVYNEVNKTYSKFIQMSKNQDYSLKLIGNDIGTVNCKVSETSVDGIISSKQFENLPIKKGTTIITNTINNLSELTYTVDKEGDGSNKKTCGFIDAKASSYVAVTGIVKLENVTKMSVGSKKALGIQVQPINASYQNVSWTSSNENVLSVNSEGVATAKSIGSSIITAKTEDGGYQLNYTIIVSTNPTVTYRTHVQNVGWQDYVSNSATSGTSGQSLRLEGINIKLENQNDLAGSIRYKTHIQNIGWEKSWNYDGAMSGTTGKSYRLEAIQIELTGEMANQYDIYYRVHAQNIGWMGWAKNGEQAGTAGYAYRLEAIQIELVKKGGSAPDASDSNTSEAFRHPMVQYQTHVQNIGWQGYVQDGAMSGTSGQSLRLEGIHINLSNQDYAGSIQYKTHVQNIGWQNWVSDGALSGTSGQSLRLEAIQIQLTGEMANHFDVYYRVHSQNIGWMGWAKNGEEAGTAGFAYRLEGIEIQLVQKDGAAPGLTDNHFVQR